MPQEILVSKDNKSIELKEFIELVKCNNYDFANYDDLVDSAKYLNQLNNNKSFLLDLMCEELMGTSFQKNNFYGPQVFILHSNEKYFLRAVVWNPISAAERTIAGFRYDICHDHNFDILTIGYFGPGYESRGYSYDFKKITGLIDEEVDMKSEGTIQLSEGKIFLYRAKKDIHMQMPPSSLSVSINLIPNNSKISSPQFEFNESTHKISRYLQISGNELIVRMAGVTANIELADILYSIFKKTNSPHIKAYAGISLIQISNSMRTEIYESLQHDKLALDLFVKESEGVFNGIGN
ncbi:MAG TPA: hypothetical protein VK787_09570 [Puia sp.]|jgi:hypothetical protein|nr:hypothetical protein [Puia sp.]